MISDPIIIKNYPDDELFQRCKRYGQLDLFYELHVGDATVIALIDTVKSNRGSYWFKFVLVSFPDKRSESYTVDGPVFIGDVTRERFIELMMERYPGHFEWFLYHPEHLK
mgnify:CR=1 FL=1